MQMLLPENTIQKYTYDINDFHCISIELNQELHLVFPNSIASAKKQPLKTLIEIMKEINLRENFQV